MSTQMIADLFRHFREENVTNMMGIPGYRLKLDCYAGLRSGFPALMVLSRSEVPEFKSSAAVTVSQKELRPGVTELILTVTNHEAEDLFYKICADLLDVMVGAPNASSAVSRMAARYEAWQDFWRSRRGAMSEEAVRGLAGELLYLKGCLRAGMNPDAAVRGWIGPEKRDQDFVFPDGWAEVKTVGQSASEVRIASLEQLVNPRVMEEDMPDAWGRLVIYRFQNNPAGDRCFTLAGLCEEIRDMLREHPHALNHFANSVEMVGADLLHGEHERKMKLQLVEKMVYDVNGEGFPRLIRGDKVPAAVTKADYSLSIPALEPWKVGEEAEHGHGA